MAIAMASTSYALRRTLRLIAVALLAWGLAPVLVLAQSLDATDPAEIGRAITAAAHPGDRALASALAARIERGLPAPLLSRAIDALVQNGSPPAISALLQLTSHRRAAVRAHVARSLAAAHAASARRVLADLLDDPEAEVRAAAARALGEVGPLGVMDTVMLAAIRGVADAAILLGEHASAADVARVVRALDGSTLEALAPALRILLLRAQVARPAKLSIVRRLDAIGGVLGETLLREVAATLPETDALRRAIDEAVAAEDAATVEGASP
jgi:HEAT repeat protein